MPVRVSIVVLDIVAAREETLRGVFVGCVVVLVVALNEEFVGIKTDVGLTERADTVVFNGVLDVIVRVARAVEVFVRDAVFSPRTALSALVKQNKHAQIKAKIFFISRSILAGFITKI